jgi:hypothetical protein
MTEGRRGREGDEEEEEEEEDDEEEEEGEEAFRRTPGRAAWQPDGCSTRWS